MEKGIVPRNAPCPNDKGFTLIEMLLSLFIFLMIATMTPLAVRSILADGLLDSGIRRMEWEVFRSQVKKEIRSAEEMTVFPDKLLMKINGKMILYERYGTNLRRRVDYQGHEILLQNITGFQFRSVPDGIELTATETNGHVVSSRFQKYFEIGEVAP